jgi:PhnB protein
MSNNSTSVTPYLCTHDGNRALEFYKAAFGAVETMRIAAPGGRIGHAEIKIGNALIMLADEYPEIGVVSPQSLKGTSVTLHLVVPSVDEVCSSAVAAGATLERPVKNEFYGMRTGTIIDPFGHRWMIATVTEQLSNEEVLKRAAALHGGDK